MGINEIKMKMIELINSGKLAKDLDYLRHILECDECIICFKHFQEGARDTVLAGDEGK